MMNRYLSIISFALILLCCTTSSIAQENHSIPFFKGYHGYEYFRIPAIIKSPDGSLLAFSEARKNGRADNGDIDLVLRRSHDNGKTWDDMIIVWDDSINTCGNPVPVLEQKSGRIFLFACWNRGEVKEEKTAGGATNDSRHVYVMHSDDNGTSWSNPENLTSTLKLSDWTWYATGPCHGIQKIEAPFKYRIIIPANHKDKDGRTFSHIIYSDDCGVTWNLGGTALAGGNESTITELKGGNLMLNMRNYNREKGTCRAYAISKNGGKSWGKMKYAPELSEPQCQGSILNYSNNGKLSDTLLFSNPHNSGKRINMSVSISVDSGKNWKKQIPIFKGKSAYSDIVKLEDGSIGILYENGDNELYERITCEIVPIKE